MQRFRFKDFAVGIWRTPPIIQLKTPAERQTAAEAYFEHCKKLGLTVVKSNQVAELDAWLAAADKADMPIIIHAVKSPDEAWGPQYPPARDHRIRGHYARLGEFKWLFETYHRSPRVVGYLLNDNCGLHDYTVAISRYLLEKDAGVLAWMSTNPHAAGQGQVPMPVLSSQIYPFKPPRGVAQLGEKGLQQWRAREPYLRRYFCSTLEQNRADANRYDMAIWPIGTCSGATPAQMRFQGFAALAYGAQGLWYFHVGGVLRAGEGPSWQPQGAYESMRAAHAEVVPCGRQLLGHRSLGVFHNKAEDIRGAWAPGEGRLIEAMDEDLLAGVLVPEAAFLRGMREDVKMIVADKRTREPDGAARAVRVKFAPHVRGVEAFSAGEAPAWRALARDADGWTPLPPLRGGQGVLLRLRAQSQAVAPMIAPPETYFEGELAVTLRRAPGQVIRYTVDGSEPTAESAAYTEPIKLTKTTDFRARAFPQDNNVLPSITSAMVFRRVDPLVRIDRQINFDWKDGSPGGQIPPDNFTAVWTGYLKPQRTGTVRFYTVSDDGVRLWIDGRKVIDDWSVHGPHERSGSARLTAGRATAIKVQYFDRDGGATVKLMWSGGGGKALVPAGVLFADEACKQSGLKATYRIRTERP